MIKSLLKEENKGIEEDRDLKKVKRWEKSLYKMDISKTNREVIIKKME